MQETPSNIHGAEQLAGVFGYWPSFHDAEVLRFSLDRSGYEDTYGPTADCIVHVFEMTNEVSPEGYYVLKNHSLVTFRFLEIVQLELFDFNQQNALWGLKIEDISGRQMERVKFAVEFSASHGMAATFQCFAVEVVSVRPCDSEGQAVGI